jgi:hypothetical protein
MAALTCLASTGANLAPNTSHEQSPLHTAAIHFMHYNFCRIHTTLRVTPAMEAGITDHVWSLEEVIGLL